jgi:signal transduction histidine kinase
VKRPWLIWLTFASCVGIAAGALAWMSTLAFSLERAEASARQQAAQDENLQLALWRIDSALAPLIAEEGTRPYFEYNAFYPAERAYTHMFEVVQKGDVLVASPLLTHDVPFVLLHFQFGPDGRLTSPQVPDGNMRDLAEARFITPERLEDRGRKLDRLRSKVSQPAMTTACSIPTPIQPAVEAIVTQFADTNSDNGQRVRSARASTEYQMRARNAQKAQTTNEPVSSIASATSIAQAPMQAVWIGDALILGRRVRVGDATFLQGCWLDWDAMRAELLQSVADLVPNAVLSPIGNADNAPTRRLAAVPAILVGKSSLAVTGSWWSPLRVSVAMAWAGLIVAAGAVALLLAGTLTLSERRGTFVSAVTHELRTPLTTFRLYTEMLAQGMVSDPAARGTYLSTLQSEAERLGRLVENVLAFAQLERGRAIERSEVVSLRELIERAAPGLSSRAEQGGMTLRIGELPDVPLRTNPHVVQQVLSNLVDNAVKYAGGGTDRMIALDATSSAGHAVVTVSDHGPGLPRRALRRLYRPFSKSAHDAAGTAPGVGLGLALSRRLAQALGGELRLEATGPEGTRFALWLPAETRTHTAHRS